jgi:small conductance mechanosensitive channel
MRSFPDKLFDSFVIILISIAVFFIIKYAVRAIEIILSRYRGQGVEREIALRVKTIGKIMIWLIAIGIMITAVYMILETYGVSVTPLLAGAGILGLAFGFGGQYLTRDVINGFFILLEGQYRIDDVVKIGEFGGLVEDINLRITTLRDLEGRVIIIPNGEIKTVINLTKEYAHALFDMRVAYKENVDKVMEVIKEVGAGLRKDGHFGPLIMSDLEMLGVDDFSDSAVVIKFRIKTLPIRQWDVSREFRRRLKNSFDELGIEIPFPQLEIHRNDVRKKGRGKGSG